MSKKSRYHVTQKENGDWQGKQEGAQRASTTASTKQEAVKQTIEIAKNKGESQVIIHKQDGKIQEERTYGTDPNPPKG
jgi:uncharacterized protein YdaT